MFVWRFCNISVLWYFSFCETSNNLNLTLPEFSTWECYSVSSLGDLVDSWQPLRQGCLGSPPLLGLYDGSPPQQLLVLCYPWILAVWFNGLDTALHCTTQHPALNSTPENTTPRHCKTQLRTTLQPTANTAESTRGVSPWHRPTLQPPSPTVIVLQPLQSCSHSSPSSPTVIVLQPLQSYSHLSPSAL